MTGTKTCIVCKIVGLLVGIGALNWGLVAIFNVNLVSALLGEMTGPAKVLYALVGIAGVIKLISLVKPCPACCATGSCDTKK